MTDVTCNLVTIISLPLLGIMIKVGDLGDNVRQPCSNTLKNLEEEYFDNCTTESIFIVLRCIIQTLVLSLQLV